MIKATVAGLCPEARDNELGVSPCHDRRETLYMVA